MTRPHDTEDAPMDDDGRSTQAEVHDAPAQPAEDVPLTVPQSGAEPAAPFDLPLLDADPPYVYALGSVEPRFPTLGIEKEFAQATGRRGDEALTDRQALKTALEQRESRYLARHLCWVFLIEGLEAYILVPRDPADLELLIEAVRYEPSREDVDV